VTGLPRRLAAEPDMGARIVRGTVVTWDSGSGYTVSVGGATVTITAILGSAAGTLSPGDVVALARQKSNLLLLGKVAAPS
jgi:hypothetical protein